MQKKLFILVILPSRTSGPAPDGNEESVEPSHSEKARYDLCVKPTHLSELSRLLQLLHWSCLEMPLTHSLPADWLSRVCRSLKTSNVLNHIGVRPQKILNTETKVSEILKVLWSPCRVVFHWGIGPVIQTFIPLVFVINSSLENWLSPTGA